MKIFASILLATIALTNAIVSELVLNNYNQDPPLTLYPPTASPPRQPLQQKQQHQHQETQPQPQYLKITQPSQHYFTTPRYTPPVSAVFPMPSSFSNGVVPLTVRKHVTRHLRPRAKAPKKPIITKSFFIHSAPDDGEVEAADELNQLEDQPRQHFNVLFVKAPTQTSKSTAVNFANSIKAEKTVVYVLSKKTTAADLQEAIGEQSQQLNKPEVFFIKYRTAEEAAHAQQQIQSQYENLGGSSTITNEGAAPVTSFVGSLDAREEEEEVSEIQQLNPQEQSSDQQQVQDAVNFNQQLAKSINSMSGGGNNDYLPPLRQ